MAEFYNTGAVSVTADSTAVKLAGGMWNSVLAGDTLELAGQRVTLAAVGASPFTSATLAAPWSGVDQFGASYVIRYDAPQRFTSGYLAEQVRALIAQTGIIKAARPNYEVQSIGANAPPVSPVTGDLYVVGTAPTGAWAGQANNLARWTGSAWLFSAPARGSTVTSAATNIAWFWTGGAWLRYRGPVSTRAANFLDAASDAAALATLGGTALQALAGLTGAAGSIPRFTGAGASDAAMQAIVGTVSQSGGVPTGAIIEWGQNANGIYIKFADRTMICWQRAFRTIGVVPAANFVSLGALTFPAEFASSPSVFCTYEGAWSVYLTAAIQTVSATGIAAAYISNFSSAGRDAGNNYFYYTAIGRWF